MHELPITQSIIKICCEEVEKHKAKKVKEIRIKVGELSGLVPESIQYYFDIVSKDTLVEGAVLKIEKIMTEIKCNSCGYEGILPNKKYSCSNCGDYDIKITKGNEFLIDSLEVD